MLGSDGSVALTCGLTVKGTIASGSAQAGDLVKVSSIGVNQLSVNALSKSCRYSLNVSAAALGSIPLSDGVKIYERVGAGPVVEIGLDDILSDTVSSARIDFYATDDEGRVCLLLLDDATGYAYTYGFLVADTKTSAGISSDDTVTNKTIAVKNQRGYHAGIHYRPVPEERRHGRYSRDRQRDPGGGGDPDQVEKHRPLRL